MNDKDTSKRRFYIVTTEAYEKLISQIIQTDKGIFIVCDYCKHYIHCSGKNCSKYKSGKILYDKKTGEKIHHEWDCMDFDFGTCDRLKNTPCNGCIGGERPAKPIFNNFKWNGKYPESISFAEGEVE